MKKFLAIITTADKKEIESMDPDYYADRPWAGRYCTVAEGNTSQQLLCKIPDNEGRLYYQLYETATGEEIGYGVVDENTFEEDISEWLKGKSEDSPLHNLYSVCCNVNEYLCRELQTPSRSNGWKKTAEKLQEQLRNVIYACSELFNVEGDNNEKEYSD